MVIHIDDELYKRIFIDGIGTNYSISSHGNVRNDKTGRILNQSITVDGYPIVRLQVPGKNIAKTCRVHRLVAMAFIDNPNKKPTVNHIDGWKTNNDVINLEWATSSEQIKHAYDTGIHTRKCPTVKVTDDKLKLIINYINEGMSNIEISKKTNTPHYTISAIRNNNTNLAKFNNVQKHIKPSKFSKELLHDICKLIDAGYSNKLIFDTLITKHKDISKSLIEKVKSGKRYIPIVSQYNFYKTK